jgi:hypothetical protein
VIEIKEVGRARKQTSQPNREHIGRITKYVNQINHSIGDKSEVYELQTNLLQTKVYPIPLFFPQQNYLVNLTGGNEFECP